VALKAHPPRAAPAAFGGLPIAVWGAGKDGQSTRRAPRSRRTACAPRSSSTSIRGRSAASRARRADPRPPTRSRRGRADDRRRGRHAAGRAGSSAKNLEPARLRRGRRFRLRRLRGLGYDLRRGPPAEGPSSCEPRFERVPRGDGRARGAALPRGHAAPVDARREPDEVAPRAHDVVLRQIRPSSPRAPPRFDQRYDYVWNSYYDAVGERHARHERGLLSRPERVRRRAVSAARRRRPCARLLDGPRRALGRGRSPRSSSGCTTSSSTRSSS